MKIELSVKDLVSLVKLQLNNFFGTSGDIESYIEMALKRVNKCFEVTRSKYYNDNMIRVSKDILIQ